MIYCIPMLDESVFIGGRCNRCSGFNDPENCPDCSWLYNKTRRAQQIAKKYSAGHDQTVTSKNLRKKFLGVCHYCKREIQWMNKDTTIDHVVPFSKNGKNTIGNVEWCCRDCNGWKKTSSKKEFLEIRKRWKEGYRRCYKCLKFKPFSEFYKHKNRRGGIREVCKACACKRRRKCYR